MTIQPKEHKYSQYHEVLVRVIF